MANVTPGGGGGTHPRKVRVDDLPAEKLKLYLYKFAKKWCLFYIILAKKRGLFYIIVTKINVEVDNFQKLGVNWTFLPKISVRNLII